MTHDRNHCDEIMSQTEGTGEPVFVLRAQDKYAAETIRHYQRLVDNDTTNEYQELVDGVAKEFEAWQQLNQDYVHVPDVPGSPSEPSYVDDVEGSKEAGDSVVESDDDDDDEDDSKDFSTLR